MSVNYTAKTIAWGIFLLLFVLFPSSSAIGSESVIRVGIYQNPPKIFLTEDNQPAGFYPKLLNFISQQEGWTLEYVPCAWSECLEKVEKGELDLMPDVAWTEERAERFDFNQEIVLSSWSRIYAKEEGLIRSILDLDGKRVAVLKGSFQARKLAEQARAFGIYPVYQEVEHFSHVFEMIEQGLVDAGISNHFIGAQQKGNYKIVETDIVLFPSRLHFVVPRGKNTEVLAQLDGQLERLKDVSDSIYYRSRDALFAPVSRIVVPRIKLTDQERAWLDEHKRIRIGIDDNYAPYSFRNAEGRYIGVLPDFMDLISSLSGISFEIVPDLKWSELLEGVKKRDLDVIVPVIRTPEREAFLNFPDALITTPLVIMTRKGDEWIRTADDLAGKRVALVRGFSSSDRVVTEYPSVVRHMVDTATEGLHAVAVAEADAYVGVIGVNDYLIRQHGLLNLKIAARYEREDSGQGFAVRKDWPELSSILNKAQEAIPKGDRLTILNKWVPVEASWYASKKTVELTDEERAWLKAHPRIVLGTDANWRPYVELNDDGSITGVEADLIDRINQLVGTNIEIAVGKWPEMVEKAQQREIDGLALSAYHKEREWHFLFSDSPYSVSKYIYTRAAKLKGMADLVGRKVAFLRGNRAEEKLLERQSGIIPVGAEGNEEMISMLLSGQVEAVIGGINFRLTVQEKLIPDIDIAFIIPESEMHVVYSIRKDWPELHSIINKALASIPSAERLAILERWGQRVEIDRVELELELTEDERAWLDEHKDIQFATSLLWPPFDFVDKEGKHAGYHADLLTIINERLGTNIQVTQIRWAEALQQVKEKKYDGLMGPSLNKERKTFMLFTESYADIPSVILSRKDFPDAKNLHDFHGRTLAITQGNSSIATLKKNHPQIDFVLKPTALDTLLSVSTGEVDGSYMNLSAASYLISKNFITNLKVVYTDEEVSSDSRLGIRKDWPLLQSILQKALDSISRDEREQLARKWIYLPQEELVQLSQEERAWLREHPVLRLGYHLDSPPLAYADEPGEYQGMSVEYFSLISEMLDVTFEPVVHQSWKDMIAAAKAGQLDILSAVTPMPQHDEYLRFTTPYLSFPMVIVTGPDYSFITDLGTLEGKSVGVVEGGVSLDFLQNNYPNLALLPVRDIKTGLQAVQKGDADAFIGSLISISHVMGRARIPGLKISGETPYRFELGMGTRKDQPFLASIMQKALDAIPESKRAEIFNRWVSIKYERGFDYTLLWQIIAAVAIVLILFIYWNRRLVLEVDQRKQIEEALLLANERLRELDSLKSMFIASMSHELRTPLNSIIGFTGILLKGIDGEVNNQQRDSLERVQRAGRHLLSLISDVIDISKIEAGRVDAYAEDFALNKLLQEAVDSILPQAKAKHLSLSLEGANGLELHTDRKRLLQCVLNYLSNAVKFTEIGSVSVLVSEHTSEVEIAVHDTGIGIAEEELPRLFEAFERLETHLRVKTGGTGLGLYLTKKIITELLDGEIFVKSEPGSGSTFGLRIPKVLTSCKELPEA